MTTKTIVSDLSPDSLLINAEDLSFDKKGNYLFQAKKKDGLYFISNADTIGPLKKTNTIYSSNGNLTYGYDDKDFLYYLNPNDIKAYGPVKGKIETSYTNDSYDYVIVSILNGDSLYYYANGELINTKHKTNGESPMLLNYWVTFSSDKKIYVTDKRGQWSVISGDKIIATSRNKLSQPAVNNKGDYLFVEGMKPNQPSRYSYQFYIHTKDTVLGPVRTVWSYRLNDDGSWFYTGDDDGPEYIAINNKLYRDIDTIQNIILLDKENYFFTYKKKGKTFYNHNGREYEHAFKNATDFKIDREGNLSFYCIKDYYLYKVLNGRLVPHPITNYGVRPSHIYLSATGVSFHCFITDDSMYLYKDDQLIFPPAPIVHFTGKDLAYEFPVGERNNNRYPAKEFRYFEWRDSGYVIYNETISRGMMPFVNRSFMKKRKIGEIVGGSVISTGFFIIQKTGEEKYFININNKIYKELNNISRLIPDFSFSQKTNLFFMLYGEKILSGILLSFKKAISSIIIFLISLPLLSQKMPSDYFSEGLDFERNGDLDSSLASFEYIINNYPKNAYYANSYYNATLILYKKKNYTESLLRFKNILRGNFNEYEPRGGGITSDPYTNYRHWSSVYISYIFYDQQQFDSSLYYFSLSDTLYDYAHFCGNAIEGMGIATAKHYALLYEKLNQPDNAIAALLKFALPRLNGNRELVDELKRFLAPKAKTINLKKELDKAISSLKKIENEPGSIRDDEYVFVFLGNEVKIEAGYFYKPFDKDPPGKQKIIKQIKASYFYKTVASIK